MPSVDVKDLGEFGLIERITQWVKEGTRAPVNPPLPLEVGIGDDAAAWRSDGALQLWTTDTMVEGVHFLRESVEWANVGWKIMAANVSDIAAMGGTPCYALVTLGLREDTLVEEVEQLYQGMVAMANGEGVTIAGGDVVKAPVFFVTVALAGVAHEALLTRSAAKEGDLVAMSGYQGLSAGGLRLVLEGMEEDTEAKALLREAHFRPRPQVALGRHLVAAGVRAAIDTSDGLIADLGKLCLASHVGARVDQERVPVHPALLQVFPEEWWDLVFGGGEEYQLVFTAPPSVMERVAAYEQGGVTVIGEIVGGEPGTVTVVDSSGKEVTLSHKGWDHFRS